MMSVVKKLLDYFHHKYPFMPAPILWFWMLSILLRLDDEFVRGIVTVLLILLGLPMFFSKVFLFLEPKGVREAQS